MSTGKEKFMALNHYYTVWREINVLYEEWAKKHDLSLNSLMLLYDFYAEEALYTQKQLSQKWAIPKQTVHAFLKELAIKRYVKLIPNATDKRQKRIQLTPSGKQYVNTIISDLRRLELAVINQMGLEHMQAMNQNLDRFAYYFAQKGQRHDD